MAHNNTTNFEQIQSSVSIAEIRSVTVFYCRIPLFRLDDHCKVDGKFSRVVVVSGERANVAQRCVYHEGFHATEGAGLGLGRELAQVGRRRITHCRYL